MNGITKDNIVDFCEAFNIINYKIKSDMSIDVNGDVNISYVGLSEIPFNFNKVTGNFNCSYNHFVNMSNGPKYVGGFYDVSYNELESFKDFPLSVGQGVIAYENEFDLVNSLPDFEYDVKLDPEVAWRILKLSRLNTVNNIINS